MTPRPKIGNGIWSWTWSGCLSPRWVCKCNSRVQAEGLGGERGQAGMRIVAESEG